MKVKSSPSLFFEAETLRPETTVDALLFFVERLKKLKAEVDAVVPAEPYSLPFAMLISDWLSAPIKGWETLREEERALILFSFVPYREVNQEYLYQKIKLIRESFPNTPSLLVASPQKATGVDFQLIKAPVERLFSYRFLKEASKNFFWPVEGELTYVSPELWELAKLEAKNLLRAKRIRDSARRYLKEEEITPLKLAQDDADLSIWEKFKKGLLTPPKKPEPQKELPFKPEKLFQVEDKVISSGITALLEFIAQNLELHFPTTLAYANYEVVEKEGVLILPRVREELSGADLLVEFILKSKKEKDFEKLIKAVQKAVKEVGSSVVKEAFKPHFDWTADGELGKFTLYLSWFVDREMAEALYKKVNREWLVSRLLARKRSKAQLLELLKLIKEFTFNLENLLTLKSKLASVWERNPKLFELKREELLNLLNQKNLWPLIGYLCVKNLLPEKLCSFLIKLKGYSNPHHLLAELNTYWTPVIAKRSYRGDWERVIKGKVSFSLKAEPMNPNSPVSYVLQTEEGKLLGEIPREISHYLAAKERSGKKLRVRELYFEPDIFTENSYWVEIECL